MSAPILMLFFVLLLTSQQLFSHNHDNAVEDHDPPAISEHVRQAAKAISIKNAGSQAVTADLRSLMRPVSQAPLSTEPLPPDAAFLQIDLGGDALLKTLRRPGSSTSFHDFPLSVDRSVDLDLESFRVLGEGVPVLEGSADGDRVMDVDPGVFLRGSVRGEAGSFVFLALFRDQVRGFIEIPVEDGSMPERWYVSPLPGNTAAAATMIVYHNRDGQSKDRDFGFCGSTEELDHHLLDQIEDNPAKGGRDGLQSDQRLVLQMAIECDHNYFLRFQSFASAAAYALSVTGAVSAIYQRDLNCRIEVPFLRVWTSTDPFPGANSLAKLQALRNYWNANMNHIESSTTHLFGGNWFYGGRAYISGLCSSSLRYAFSGLYCSVGFPFSGDYIWDINVVAHELGHNGSSPHTHSCSWDPPIDSCAPAEGTCFSGTRPSVGTVMSYCHLSSGNGIVMRFHPRVASKIRQRLELFSCIRPEGGREAHDIAVINIRRPLNGEAIRRNSSFTPSAVFRNAGTEAQTAINLRFQIRRSNGSLVYSNNAVIASLAPGEQRSVEFSPVSLSVIDEYEALALSTLAADSNPENDELRRPFEVVTTPGGGTITLNAPNGPATYNTGQNVTISWNSSGPESVVIRFTPDDGGTWIDVDTDADPVGAMLWKAPPIPTNRGKIRISDLHNPGLYDESANYLTIRMQKDVQVLDITRPTPTALTGRVFAPALRVRNNGSVTQTNFTVRVRVLHDVSQREVYNRVETINRILAGESVTLAFPLGLSHLSGSHLMYAVTELAGDQNPVNNELSRSFKVEFTGRELANGYSHSLAIQRNSGTVWAWGRNSSGQLGDGSNTGSALPVRVRNIDGVVSVAAGGWHSYALTEHGTVYAWGAGHFGQLGTGSILDRSIPGTVVDISGVRAIAGGIAHGLALQSDGKVYAWGSNEKGQLGDGTTTMRLTPVMINSLSGVVAIAAGEKYSVALKADGSVWAWGDNGYGQLGDGTTTRRLTPVQVSGIGSAVDICSGAFHVMALLEDHSLRAWGYNYTGQLGNGSTVNSSVPVVVSGLNDVLSIGSGAYHSIAIRDNGSIWAWGYNMNGALGDGTTTQRNLPAQATGVDAAVQCGSGYGEHSLVRKSNGDLCFTGLNTDGQLGDGTNTTRISYECLPALHVRANNRVVAGGGGHSLALKVGDGRIMAWGRNDFGQLGIGSTEGALSPTLISTLSKVVGVAGGDLHSMALTTNGRVYAWGFNNLGQLGNGSTQNSSTPIQVPLKGTAVDIATRNAHGLALRSDGTIAAWGDNSFGQLGDGSTVGSLTPVDVIGIDGVIAVAAGAWHSLVLKADGSVWAWGYNGFGQLGDGSSINRHQPVQVSGIGDAIGIAAGLHHSLALMADGSIRAWGYNNKGQLGNGSTQNSSVPLAMSGIAGVVKVAAGASSSFALLASGAIRGCGSNQHGILGDGTTIDRLTMVAAINQSSVSDLASSWYHGLIHKNGGEVCATGANNAGQLGNGTTVNSTTYLCLDEPFLKEVANAADRDLPHQQSAAVPKAAPTLSISPNPSDGRCAVAIRSAAAERLSLIVTDALGRVVERRELRNPPLILRTSLNLQGLARGIYYVHLLGDEALLARQPLLLR